jgi:hypothetical protein
MDELLDQIGLYHAPNETPEGEEDDGQKVSAAQPDGSIPALELNPYKLEPAWQYYPCEWERPRFAHILHEVDWVRLYELRRQHRAPMTSDDFTGTAPVTGAK